MGIFGKLFGALKKTKDNFSGKLRMLFSKNKLGDEFYEELEEILISSDVSVAAAEEVVERVKAQAIDEKLKDEEYVTELLRGILTDILEEAEVPDVSYPCVIMLVGVNGVGKTTTIGKLARYFLDQGKSVTVAAADTFRAAASEQLSVWAERAKVRIVKHEEGSDPAAVIFDAVSSAKAKRTDVVIVDTAGRLHVKDNLMKELQKMDRVVTREYPEADFLKLLVLDATTGQNAVSQARTFDEAVELDGLVLTKLDGTAKGGFVFSLASELALPVIFAGTGEKIEDLEKFDAKSFVDAILEKEQGRVAITEKRTAAREIHLVHGASVFVFIEAGEIYLVLFLAKKTTFVPIFSEARKNTIFDASRAFERDRPFRCFSSALVFMPKKGLTR